MHIRDPFPEGSPADCEVMADIRVLPCDTCSPSSCYVCLNDLSESGGTFTATLGPGQTVEDLPSCRIPELVGSTRLSISGTDLSGTFASDAAGAITFQFLIDGEFSMGGFGDEVPATGSCTINAVRE